MSQLRGVTVPSITFYNKEYEVDTELHALLNRHLLVNGADSLYLFGSTGEGVLFSYNKVEKAKLINLTIESTGKKIPLMVGVLGNEREEIVEEINDLSKKFNEVNFVLAPPYKEKIDDLQSHFTEIFDSISIKNSIFLCNNPIEFGGNEITPSIVNNLMDYISGIIDSSDNINYWKSYIQMINEEFTIYCGKEENFQKFLQLIPLNLRKSCGIIPSISNLVNICSKLYYCALEDNILALHQLQDQINDIRNKVYDIKIEKGKIQRGLKYSFLYLYRDIIQNYDEIFKNITPEFQRELDEITKVRIQATINSLLNQKAIYQLYSLGKEEIYQLDDIIKKFSNVDILNKQGKIKKIVGPFNAHINTIYRVNFENNQLIFRFRTSKSFKNENLIKEKLLFPFLDGSINPNLIDFREKVKEIISTTKGEYIFKVDSPPLIPVANLIYYDETKEAIPFLFSIHNYIHGKTLKSLYEKYKGENFSFNKSKFLNLFTEIGELLGRLHNINFKSFYKDIYEFGKEGKEDYIEFFNLNLNRQIQVVKKNNFILEKQIMDYISDRITLLEGDSPILIHNDFQWTNIIIKDDPIKFQINGIIDFDNWMVGVRAQDFVEMEHLTFKTIDNTEIRNKFYEGYQKYYKVNSDFHKKIDLFSVLYYLREYNNAIQERLNPNLSLEKLQQILDHI
ncbi:MAG: dihydrodipicolinate synthase family protein [Promethearchaeota archaeon]